MTRQTAREGSTIIHVRLNPEQKIQLRELAASKNISMAAVLRQAAGMLASKPKRC